MRANWRSESFVVTIAQILYAIVRLDNRSHHRGRGIGKTLEGACGFALEGFEGVLPVEAQPRERARLPQLNIPLPTICPKLR